MVEFRDVVKVLSHMCRAYMEVEISHAKREKQERRRRERQRDAINVEYSVIK